MSSKEVKPKAKKKAVKKIVAKQGCETPKNVVSVKIKADDPRFVPQYQTEGAANVDLVANVSPDVHGNKQLTLTSRTMTMVDVGFSMELPAGWKAEVSARSGWAKRGLVVTNAPGQIDEDYRGRVCVLVANLGKEILVINDGDRIGQMWPTPVHKFAFESVEGLSESGRGENGFGSTGNQ